MGVLQKVRGTRDKALQALYDHFKAQLDRYHIPEIYVTHLDCDQEAKSLIEKVQLLESGIEIKTGRVGCVLATHSGPKPIGIAYHIK